MFRLLFLGPLQIWHNELPMRGFKARKVQAVLSYLAHQKKATRRVFLANFFWGDKSEARGRANLSWALNNITKLMPNCLYADRHTVQFIADARFWLDTAVFTQYINTEEITARQAAVDLYRGDFMEEFHLDDCPEFTIWLTGEQERWRQHTSQTLHHLIDHYLINGELTLGIEQASRLLALDAWREEAHQQMMRLLALDGQRSAALAQYETCRRILSSELGVTPTAETTALYQRIRDGRLPPSTPIHLTEAPLPTPATPFIGREAEIAQIEAHLQNPACRLLTLIGNGGVGKTRLALQIATRYRARGEQPVYFVPLAPVHSPNLLATAIANALNFSFHSAQKLKTQLFNYLQGKTLLLILDNFEHLREGVAFLAEMGEIAPQLKILVTSRERLQLHGEWVVEVSGLRYPATITETNAFESYSAIQLFFQTAKRVHPTFTPTSDEIIAITHICHLVGGMPLGVELAAIWVKILSCQEIAEEVSQNLDFLATSMPDIPERHRSLRAVFDQSWQRLTQPEQTAVQQMALFRTPFRRQAAKQIAQASLPLLFDLVDKSFVRKTATGRYELVELLRQYAEAKLRTHPHDYQGALRRYSHFYATFLQKIEPMLYHHDEIKALTEIGTEIENIRQVWQWAIQQRETAVIQDCSECLYRFYEARFLYEEGAHSMGQAVTILENDVDLLATHQHLWAQLMIKQADFQNRLGKHELVKQRLEKSMSHIRQLNEPLILAFGLRIFANVMEQLGQMPMAHHYITESIALYRQLDNLYGLAMALHVASNLLNIQGETAKSAVLNRESLRLFRQLNHQEGIANTTVALGGRAYHLGDYEMAKQHFQDGVAIYQAIGAQHKRIRPLLMLGAVAEAQGEYDEAQHAYEAGLIHFKEIGDQQLTAYTLNNLGNLAYIRGAFEQAHTHLEESVRISRQIGHKRRLSRALNCLGAVMRAEAAYTEAKKLQEESLQLRQALKDRWGEGYTLDDLGRTNMLMGHKSIAQQQFEQSLAIFRDIANHRGVAMVLNHLGLAAFNDNQIHGAKQLWQEALTTAVAHNTIPQATEALAGLGTILVHQGNEQMGLSLLAFTLQQEALEYETAVRWQTTYKQLTNSLPQTTIQQIEAVSQAWDWQTAVAQVNQLLSEQQ